MIRIISGTPGKVKPSMLSVPALDAFVGIFHGEL
jgi:hypothetical protein